VSLRLGREVRAKARVGLAALVLGLAPAVASADAKAGEQKAQLCLLCHKPNNPAAYVPTLEGQPWQYLYNQIKAYREERRPGDIMQTNARSLTEADIRDLADFFAAQTPVRASFALDPGTVTRGRARASELRCGTCHRASFAGEQAVPRLAGLDPRYGLAQILDFIGGKRPHPSLSGLRLSADDAAALAQFLASLD
jgi:cytochrome c553